MKRTVISLITALLLAALFCLPAAAEEPACEHGVKTLITVAEPTCTEPGEELYRCEICGADVHVPLPAPGHDYEETLLEPTCTEPGGLLKVCRRCGDEVNEDLPALGHDYAVAQIDPTCTEPGSIHKVCNRCFDVQDEVLPAPGHDYIKTEQPPTCLLPGRADYRCSRCSDSYGEDLPALGHDYVKTETAPTCLLPGRADYRCSRCEDSYGEDLPALGHEYQKTVVEPTCTAGGWTRYVCVRGDDAYTGDPTSALGHTYGDWTVTIPPTYRAPGEEARFCIRCADAIRRGLAQLTHLAASLCKEGDADMDGTVTAADARLILRIAVGFDDGLDKEQHGKADFDGKEGVTAADARYALRVAVGMDPYAPTLKPGYTFLGYTAKGYALAKKDGLTYVVSSYGYTLIANKTYSLPSTYAPGDLTPECRAAFNELVSAAARDNVNIFVVSGYRSYSLQASLYQRYAAKDGYAAADTYSARPGHSEHQTGLAMDVNSLSSSFADTREGRWLAANAWKYGFIIRYPLSKQSITGYIYEPWHIRYLGKSLAAAVYQSGLCLEEFFGITSVYQ